MIQAKLPALGMLALAAAACLLLSITSGSADIDIAEIWSLLWQDDGSVHARIIHELRLPRTLSAFAVGGLLGPGVGLAAVLASGIVGNAVNAVMQPPHHSSVGGSTAASSSVGVGRMTGSITAGRSRACDGAAPPAWS